MLSTQGQPDVFNLHPYIKAADKDGNGSLDRREFTKCLKSAKVKAVVQA